MNLQARAETDQKILADGDNEQRNKADKGSFVEQQPTKIKPDENYFYINSRCRISLNQYKKNVVINNNYSNIERAPPKEVKESNDAKVVKRTESKIQPQPSGILPCDIGLLELENENYSDFKNYFNSKTNRLFISINLEHEDTQELNNTLCSILNNLNYLNKKIQFNQNEVSIIVIADGISRLHTDFKKLLFNSETIMKDPSPPPTQNIQDYMHCFRAIYGDSEYQQNPNPFRKLDLMFVVKETHMAVYYTCIIFFNNEH